VLHGAQPKRPDYVRVRHTTSVIQIPTFVGMTVIVDRVATLPLVPRSTMLAMAAGRR
jgi:hypothetical protein